MKNSILAVAVSLALVSLGTPASAHVVLQDKEAEAGASYRAVLVVGHGCGEAPTTALRVQIPEGLYNVKPMPKPGWTIETVVGPYQTPFMNHGTELTEGVKEISWTGSSLPDDFFDEFTFRGTFGPHIEAGSHLYFPVIQTCGDEESPWIDQSGDPEVEFPAPAVMLAPAAEHAH